MVKAHVQVKSHAATCVVKKSTRSGEIFVLLIFVQLILTRFTNMITFYRPSGNIRVLSLFTTPESISS